MAFMFQAGGGILDKDGKLIFGTDARDANIKALTYMTDFATKHKVMPEGIASYNTEDAHTVFLQGRAAFGFGTGGLIGRIMRENPDMFDKVGILEVLEGPAGRSESSRPDSSRASSSGNTARTSTRQKPSSAG